MFLEKKERMKVNSQQRGKEENIPKKERIYTID